MILSLALQMQVLQGEPEQIILMAVLLSMVAAPILIRYSAAITERVIGANLRQTQRAAADNIQSALEDRGRHVILCGYGRMGQSIDAGATEVVPDTLETGLTLAAHVLTLLGLPVAEVAERNEKIRADRYRLLRGMFHQREQRHHLEQLRVITIPTGAFAVGRTLGELRLKEHSVRITAARRDGVRTIDPPPDMRLQPEDALILQGSPDALSQVERLLADGGGPD